MNVATTNLKGRGAGLNPANRFESSNQEIDPEFLELLHQEEDALPPLKTELFPDKSQTILAKNDSPDVGFTYSVNPYRGCEHGCVYCYARPTHEYLGFSSGLDFESKIVVKYEAANLLAKALANPRWKPQTVAMSGNTDCYQPVERKLEITRACLEVFARFRNPVTIITKNALVLRDLDILKELASHQAVHVFVSVTTLNTTLARILEPRASMPPQRLAALRALTAAGIPCGVMVAPVIPALTEPEIPSILKAAADAGAQTAGYVLLRLPHANKDLFVEWLDRYFPDRKNKILHHLEDMRGGKLYQAGFGTRMRGTGVYAEQIRALFKAGLKKCGMPGVLPPLSAQNFLAPQAQFNLF